MLKTCLVSRLWFSGGLAVSMGEAAKLVLLSCCQLWKSPEVSYEMLVFCIHVSCLESLVFLLRRRVYGGSWKTCPFRLFPSRLSCCFAWQTWHFLTFHPVWWCSQNFKIGGSLVGNAGFSASTSPCLWGKLENMSYSNVSKQVIMSFCVAGVALCDIPNLFDNVLKMSKLEEVSYEMLVFLHPHVLSRVAGFPVASPSLWGKLENLSFSNVSKQVVMSFCVADVALSDIPTCLMMFTKFQNWRKSRRKCSFFCAHVSRLESLVFLWRRRVYGGSSALHTLHFTLHTPQLTL